jgi:hypothetical protein
MMRRVRKCAQLRMHGLDSIWSVRKGTDMAVWPPNGTLYPNWWLCPTCKWYTFCYALKYVYTVRHIINFIIFITVYTTTLLLLLFIYQVSIFCSVLFSVSNKNHHVLLGQWVFKHDRFWVESPTQSAPPCAGAGCVQVRVRVMVPCPHVTEQSPLVQGLHPPLTIKTIY